MISAPIEQITEAHLQQLGENNVPEGKTLEYKRKLPGNETGGAVKILRSITSLANTSGGDLIYGISAEDGVPVEVSGMDVESQDQTLLRIENLCRDGIEPRLTSIEPRFISLANGKAVLILRIGRSWSAPHRVTVNGHGHFYGRHSSGSYQLDVDELRSAFGQAEGLAEKIRAFRVSRLLTLADGEGAIQLESGPKLVLHLIPVNAFSSNNARIDIHKNHSALSQVRPLGALHGANDRINLEGILNFVPSRSGITRTCVQIYRSGIIEAVASVTEPPDLVIPTWWEVHVREALIEYLALLRRYAVATPVFMMLSLVNAKGCKLGHAPSRRFFTGEYPPANTEVLALPEAVIEGLEDDIDEIYRPVSDLFWNSFGYMRSFNFDDNGKWQGE